MRTSPSPERTRGRRILPYAALIACTAIWGLNSHAVTIATQTLSVPFFLFLRFLVASVALPVLMNMPGPWRAVAGPGEGRRDLVPKDWLSAAGAAALLGTAYLLQTEGLTHGNAVLTVFLSSTCVLWVPIIDRLIGRSNRIPSANKIGVGLSCSGLMVAHGLAWSAVDTAAIYAFLASIAFAGEIVLVTSMSRKFTPGALAHWMLIKIAFIASGYAILWLISGMATTISEPSKELPGDYLNPVWWIGAVVFSGLFATAIALYVSAWSTSVEVQPDKPAITATSRGIIENLDAPFTLLFGLMLFLWNTPISWWTSGLILVFAGVVWSEWPRKVSPKEIGGNS